MTSTKLTWQALQPNSIRYQSIFSNIFLNDSDNLADVQPRLLNALAHLYNQTNNFILLLCSQENIDYFSWIMTAAKRFQSKSITLFGGEYQIIDDTVILIPPTDCNCPFTSDGGVYQANWFESEQLFGCVRQFKDHIQLEPGLIHKANGGTLILSINTFLLQPLLWLRLRKYIEQGHFYWSSQNERQPLPISIPALPLQLRLVLCGNRNTLASFQELDNEIYKIALYSEFEENLLIRKENDIKSWCQWTLAQAKSIGLPQPEVDFWPLLINEAVRITGDQNILPLCPTWLRRQLQETAIHGNSLNAKSLKKALEVKAWRESFISERMYDDILSNQMIINTTDEVIGQINGLSVVECSGHPLAWGTPLRITCVVYPGDNECTDVESKLDLGDNIHAKGVMIMQAYLISQLELQQHFPFSASLVLEQSYSEVNGDSASLAELCVLISALANKPLNQQIAVTGSVDQFGKVQAVGEVSRKIEGFFKICNARILTGKQGVILPTSNVHHLSLNQDVVDAVKIGQFHIWAVDSIEEALPLLTGIVWRSIQNNDESLLYLIKERINQLNQHGIYQKPWLLRLFNWFKHSY
ncbi:Lon protease family protein [Pantoea sp. Aalb]|nr:Lon protease family protein [Pantoea sp. Aalb]MXP67480.1 Lon protease family protein [Pantoea sp. Aalb]